EERVSTDLHRQGTSAVVIRARRRAVASGTSTISPGRPWEQGSRDTDVDDVVGRGLPSYPFESDGTSYSTGRRENGRNPLSRISASAAGGLILARIGAPSTLDRGLVAAQRRWTGLPGEDGRSPLATRATRKAADTHEEVPFPRN